MIVTPIGPPPQSLGLQVQVLSGRNQIQRQVGNYSALYDTTNESMQSADIELDAAATWSSNPQERLSRLVFTTSKPVQVSLVKEDDTVLELTVNRMLIVDDRLKTVSITNGNTDVIRASMNFVTYRS